MAILSPTDITGTVDWLGLVPDRAADLCARPAERLRLGWDGVEGDSHAGLTRPACSRVSRQYARETEIRNTRQLSVLSVEDLARIAEGIGLPALDPVLLGTNMVLRGIPDLTLLPPGARLIFDSGAALVVDMENAPCQFPAREIEARHPGHGRRFIAAARGRRGITAWVECPGQVEIGDGLRLHVPPQRPYPPLAGLGL